LRQAISSGAPIFRPWRVSTVRMKFEASLRCRKDPYVTQLAFMEACASRNEPKAKQYYKQMTPAQQAKFAQLCIRNRVEYQ